jgi:phospholipase/carboxylesterase
MLRRALLYARPSPVVRPAPAGLLPLELGGASDGYLYVPASYQHTRPSPLVLMLHGSGGHACHGIEILQLLSDESAAILVAPTSSEYTWEAPLGRYGAHAVTVNRALERVFAAYAIDASRIAIAGFSDGGGCACSLGLAYPGIFTHVIAFSPGFVLLPATQAQPSFFLSHGTRDEIQPIGCSQRILTQLAERGAAVEYVEFEAGHRIPPEVARRAIEWLMQAPGSERAPGASRARESRAQQEG